MKDLIQRLDKVSRDDATSSSRLQEAVSPTDDAIDSFKRELDKAKKSLAAFERDHRALAKKVEKAFEDGDERIRKMVRANGEEWQETDEGQDLTSNVIFWSTLDHLFGRSEILNFFLKMDKSYRAAYELDDKVRW